ERLLTTVDLAPALASGGMNGSGFSHAMTASLVGETQNAAASMDFRRAVNTRPLRLAALVAGFMVLLLCIERIAAPEAFGIWLKRMTDTRADIPVWANTRVWLTPEKSLLPVGDGVSVSILTRGVRAESCTLYYRPAGDKNAPWKTEVLSHPAPVADHKAPTTDEKGTPQEAAQFHYAFKSLSQSVEMYAAANDGRSNAQGVVVEPRPTLLNVRLSLHFPTYMHRDTQIIDGSTGNIAAPVGTTVGIEGKANKPLQAADFIRDDHAAGPWKVAGETASGQVYVAKDGAYALNLTDKHGFSNAKPTPRYEIHAIPDQTPEVQVTRPAADIDLVPEGSVPLVARATDDYGVVSMALNYETLRGDAMGTAGIAGLKTIRHGNLPLPVGTPGTQVNVAERWHVASAHPQAGDVLSYDLTATDNDTLNGPHVGHSAQLRIHIISLPDMMRRLKESLDEEARALEQLRQSQIAAQNQLQQARQKQDPQEIARAQEAQRAVAQDAKSVTQRVEELSAQLENNNLATKSEMDRRNEAQQTLQNVAQQKAPAAADTVQKAQNPQKNDPSRSQSLAQANQKESEIKNDIEKAQQLLQRTPTPAQLADEAKRLAKDQQTLADQSRSLYEDAHKAQMEGSKQLPPEVKDGLENARRQQDQVNQDTQRLERQLNQAAQAAQERGQEKEAQALRDAAKALQQNNVAAQQQQAQQNLNQNQPSKAAPQQDKAAAGLDKAAQAAQKAADQQNGQQATADQLHQAAEELHQLAQQQHEVANQTAQNPNSQKSQQLAQQERNIQNQAQQAQQSLNGAQRAQQSLQQAQQNLQQSGQQLSQNKPQSAQSPAQQAAQQLENAAKQAEQAAQQIDQAQKAAELADRVERLAQTQKALQSATQRLNQAQQQRPLTNNERGELGQVGARQQNVEEQARALADQFPSPAFQDALKTAATQAHPATQNLNPQIGQQPNTGQQTQTAQGRAAQTLDTIAQALKQQAQGAQQNQQNQQQNSQQQQQSAQNAQQAAALGDLALAKGLQQQARQDTGQFDQTHRDQQLTPEQQQQARQLAQQQREAQHTAEQAQQGLSDLPEVGQSIQQAIQQQQQAGQKLDQQQTGQPTQGHQDNAIQHLDQAMKQAQQAMQQQQQQQQAQQQAQQGAPQPSQKKGNDPDKNAFTRLEGVNGGASSAPNSNNGKGFTSLSPRAQRTLREGQQERTTAEYQDLVNRYYKSLSEKKR
ncbi:MAG TPA: DUF4175 family protein, partial [Chthonomonadaceae bacterium]|nr:DUF4175 family protein [Chthonomonadaceae bacterium]